MCLSLESSISSDGDFEFGVKPVVGVGAEIRGGVGVENPGITVWAGVRAAITIVEVGLPIVWVVKAVQREKDGVPVPDLYDIVHNAKISIGMEILSGFFSLFAEVGVGVFTAEWDLKLFEWSGIGISQTLFEPNLKTTTLDFQYLFTPPTP